MTYEPQKGDRVHVVAEGEVSYVYPDGSYNIGHHGTFVYGGDPDVVVSVEKVEPPTPPLPTTPGSVIRHDESGTRRSLTRKGWTCISCNVNGCAGESITRLPDPREWSTEYDAGAES